METEIKDIFLSFGIKNPVIKYTNNYAMIGSLDTKGRFEISKIAFKYNDSKGKKAIIGHEVAHIKEFNHSVKFGKLMDDMDINNDDIIVVSRYIIFCPRCREFARMNKIVHKDYHCGYCKKKGIKQPLMIYKHCEMEEVKDEKSR